MSRSTAEIVADLRIAAGCLWTVSPDTRKVAREAADRLTELDARPCPYVHTADEGTSYCTLNCTHDALRPPCPTCDGTTWRSDQIVSPDDIATDHCPDCVDGKVSVEQLAATWQAVHLLIEYPAAPADDPTNKVIRYLQGVKP